MTGKNKSISLFDVLREFVTHIDNLIFLIPSLAMISIVIVMDAQISYLAWFILGWVVFIPQEYFTHVFILHPPLPKSLRTYRLVYRLHYGHHDLPRRHDLMYMPLWLTLPMALGNSLLFYFITSNPYQLMASISGLFVGYLVFEFTHLLTHSPYQPKSSLGTLLRSRHLWHHYHNEKHWFGVSFAALIMDKVMQTDGDKDSVPKVESSQHLGLDGNHSWVLHAREHFADRSSGNVEKSKIWIYAK